MKTALSISQLETEFKSSDFVLKTQHQIAKDFGTSGIEFTTAFFTAPLSYLELINSVGEKLGQIMTLGETQTLQLLYRIDIPQQDFLALATDTEFIQKMSILIIRREAYKIYLRSVYK
jgi:hypothetical protein|tara:strand:+ start:410 stop:763 length:354 start_codon:yes stop_codon:yes gene_type:complete